MNLIMYIISPVSGAVIGYFTNWLAIKMLFRPYYERRLFGMRLPFTPGLIPKGRFKLSEKLGSAVSNNVLTNDVLNNAISSEEISKKIDQLVENGLIKLSEADITLAGALDIFLPENEKAVEYVKNAVRDKCLDYLNSEKFIELIKGYAESGELKNIVGEFSQKLFDKLRESDNSAGSYFSQDSVDQLTNRLKSLVPKAGGFIERLNEISPKTDEGLKSLVTKAAQENLGKFVGLFINYDKVYEKIKHNLGEYLQKPEAQEEIVLKLNGWLNSKLDTPISEFFSRLPDGLSNELAQKISKFAENRMNEDLTAAQQIIGKNIAGPLEKLISKLTDTLLDFNISSFAGRLAQKEREQLLSFLRTSARRLISSGGSYVIANLDMSKIIEDRLNSFEVEEAERLIISVVNRELFAITVLGGVLGFFIGLFPMLMQILGS